MTRHSATWHQDQEPGSTCAQVSFTPRAQCHTSHFSVTILNLLNNTDAGIVRRHFQKNKNLPGLVSHHTQLVTLALHGTKWCFPHSCCTQMYHGSFGPDSSLVFQWDSVVQCDPQQWGVFALAEFLLSQ